jgi:hypothetical protein
MEGIDRSIQLMEAVNHATELVYVRKLASASQRKIFSAVEHWEGITPPKYESLVLGDSVYLTDLGTSKIVRITSRPHECYEAKARFIQCYAFLFPSVLLLVSGFYSVQQQSGTSWRKYWPLKATDISPVGMVIPQRSFVCKMEDGVSRSPS